MITDSFYNSPHSNSDRTNVQLIEAYWHVGEQVLTIGYNRQILYFQWVHPSVSVNNIQNLLGRMIPGIQVDNVSIGQLINGEYSIGIIYHFNYNHISHTHNHPANNEDVEEVKVL